MTILKIQVLNTIKPFDMVCINIEAIDSIYIDKPGLYGILLRSGVVYHFDKTTYERIIRYLDDERIKGI